VVSINVALLNDPEALVATIAHELGHIHLLSDERISRDTPDHEPLTAKIAHPFRKTLSLQMQML
jgi:hypothetical protein